MLTPVESATFRHRGLKKYFFNDLIHSNHSSSPRRSSRVHANSSPESVRRQSFNKQEQPAVPTFANKDSHRSSLTAQDTNLQQKRHASHSTYKETPLSDADDYSHGTSTTHKQGRTPSTVDKEQKSSSTGNENIHRRSSFQRRSGQEPKRNSHLNADETVITPIVIDSSKNRRQNGKVIRLYSNILRTYPLFLSVDPLIHPTNKHQNPNYLP